MPIHRLSQHESGCVLDTPICIIGAGVAGLLLARKLTRRGKRVVVLESGSTAVEPAMQALNTMDLGESPYLRSLTGRYRGLGGSSLEWGGRMIPIRLHDTAERPYLNLPGWPVELSSWLTYKEEIEKLMGMTGGPFDEEALDNLDPEHLFPRDTTDFVCRWAKWPPFRRINMARTLKEDIEDPKGFDLWLDATVCDFSLDREGGRITSVKARSLSGREMTVTAGHFIFAAGTIETTRLLLWIDRRSEDRAFARTRALGHYFQDHINVEVGHISRQNPIASNRLFGYHFLGATRRSLHLELSESAQLQDKVGSAFAHISMDLSASPLGTLSKVARSLQKRRIEITRAQALTAATSLGFLSRTAYWRFKRHQVFLPANVRLTLNVCMEQLPDWTNRISLADQNDALDMPRAKLHWRPGSAEERTFRAMISRLQHYWNSSGFDQFCPIEWNQATPDADFATRAADYAHPSGSARMGVDPTTSIVRPDLHCHHVDNLSVVSSAIFPTSGSANPTMTIMAMALHHADRLH